MKLKDIANALTQIPDEGAADYMPTTLCTAVNLARILQDDRGDFVIFWNGHNKGVPSIWSGESARGMIDELQKTKPRYLYAYRLNGKDVVLKTPGFDTKRIYIHWRDVAERTAEMESALEVNQ